MAEPLDRLFLGRRAYDPAIPIVIDPQQERELAAVEDLDPHVIEGSAHGLLSLHPVTGFLSGIAGRVPRPFGVW